MGYFYKLSIMQDRDRTELYLGAKTSRTLVDSSSIHPRPLGKAIRQYMYLPWAARPWDWKPCGESPSPETSGGHLRIGESSDMSGKVQKAKAVTQDILATIGEDGLCNHS